MATAMDSSHSLASERSSIESTYELTKYLEYQLKEIKDVYLTYLGPPFNEKDFSPPRPNSTALSLPSAATRLELWHGLENQARLAQNQRAYSVLLAAVRELARSTLCPSLKTSLLHFCTGLDGLLGSISALMTTLGYALPPTAAGGEPPFPQRAERPAPLMSRSLYRSRGGARTDGGGHRGGGGQRRSGSRAAAVADGDATERRARKDGRRAEAAAAGGRSHGSRERGRGRRGKRAEPETRKWVIGEEERITEGEFERVWGRGLLSIADDGEGLSAPGWVLSYAPTLNDNNNNNNNNNGFSFSLNPQHHADTLRSEDGFIVVRRTDTDAAAASSFYHQQRAPRSLLAASPPPPPLSTLALLYQFGAPQPPLPLSLQRGTSLLPPPPPLVPLISSSSSSSYSSSSSTSTSSSSPPSAALLSVRPSMNDFARKVEGFWILRELQSWLWRSAKDFNRLKKRLRG